MRESTNHKQGWIKVHRQLLNNPICMKDGDHLAVWVFLLLNATHTEYDVIFKGKRITLKPGQLLTGRKSIASELKVDQSKVKRVLKLLKSEHQIDQQTSNKNSLITIVNWESYQKSDQQNDQQVTSKWTASGQQVTTNKNVKNINNIKNGKKHTPPTPSSGGGVCDESTEEKFDIFWEKYPRKVDKKKAKEKYKKLVKHHSEIMDGLEKQVKHFKKMEPRFIPHPTTWLNGERWKDDLTLRKKNFERESSDQYADIII